MSFRKPCHMPFRKLIPPFTLTAVGRAWELEGQLTYREYRREGPYFVLSFRLLLFWVLCGVNKSNCLKPVVGKRWSEWKSEFQIEFNIKLNWFIHERFANLSNHFQFLVPSSVKRFSTKGEQIAIHQLNNYNKAWINTNLAKTPTLFTQAMCVMTHTGSWVKLLLSLISIVKRSTSHLVREMNQTQGSKHCFLFWKTLRKRAIWRMFKIS